MPPTWAKRPEGRSPTVGIFVGRAQAEMETIFFKAQDSQDASLRARLFSQIASTVTTDDPGRIVSSAAHNSLAELKIDEANAGAYTGAHAGANSGAHAGAHSGANSGAHAGANSGADTSSDARAHASAHAGADAGPNAG